MLHSCENPLTIKNKYTGEFVTVPCGHCAVCLSQKSLQWSTRCQLESACHKYTLFFTLTYHDSVLPRYDIDELKNGEFISDSFLDSCEKSQGLIDFYGGKVPHISVDDIQKFFKLLRYYVYTKCNLSEKERCIRYYVASEYGPTTYRPHYHGLLWFDSDIIAKNIKDCIYQSWKFKAGNQKFSSFFKRNRCEFVRFNASQYVCGYTNMLSSLPPLLREKPFRPKSFKSSQPPIGYLYFSAEQVRQLVVGNALGLSFKSPISFKQFNLPLWISFENRLFPRVKSFSKLSSSDRLSLYAISSFPYGEETDIKQFTEWVRSKWSSSFPLFELLRKVISDDWIDKDGFPHLSEIKLKRLFYISRRVRELRRNYHCSLNEYLTLIENYYSRKDYECLKSQLEFQVELSNTSPSSQLCFYPCYVDTTFYSNSRSLPHMVWDGYLDQFGITNIDEVTSDKFQQFTDFCHSRRKMVEEHRKTVKKKDYVSRHPEFYTMYKNLIL